MFEDQTWETEAARISRCWDERWPVVLGEEWQPRGLATALGLVAVVRASDYRRWWDEIGKERGAPDPDTIKPTKTEMQVSASDEGKSVLVPVG